MIFNRTKKFKKELNRCLDIIEGELDGLLPGATMSRENGMVSFHYRGHVMPCWYALNGVISNTPIPGTKGDMQGLIPHISDKPLVLSTDDRKVILSEAPLDHIGYAIERKIKAIIENGLKVFPEVPISFENSNVVLNDINLGINPRERASASIYFYFSRDLPGHVKEYIEVNKLPKFHSIEVGGISAVAGDSNLNAEKVKTALDSHLSYIQNTLNEADRFMEMFVGGVVRVKNGSGSEVVEYIGTEGVTVPEKGFIKFRNPFRDTTFIISTAHPSFMYTVYPLSV